MYSMVYIVCVLTFSNGDSQNLVLFLSPLASFFRHSFFFDVYTTSMHTCCGEVNLGNKRTGQLLKTTTRRYDTLFGIWNRRTQSPPPSVGAGCRITAIHICNKIDYITKTDVLCPAAHLLESPDFLNEGGSPVT